MTTYVTKGELLISRLEKKFGSKEFPLQEAVELYQQLSPQIDYQTAHSTAGTILAKNAVRVKRGVYKVKLAKQSISVSSVSPSPSQQALTPDEALQLVNLVKKAFFTIR